jgi:hypothetical protein
MNLGMAATIWVAPASYIPPSALDYDKKQKMRKECQRDKITTAQIMRLVDQKHQQKVYAYQWLWVLGHYVELLVHLKKRANELLRQAAIQKLPDEPTECFTMPTSSGAETNLSELLTSICDNVEQAGQTAEDFMKRMMVFGGDGLTFELLLKLMRQRQFHKSAFHSLRFLNPMAQWWHTVWTNDSRVVDEHLDSYASQDPSTLGHSAAKIGRKIAKDQGKYNYHQASELIYFVLDMRMLDCWR